jgi:hypothetical protein
MKLDELQAKLTAAARQQPADERMPYAFEKRVMALIAARAGVDLRAAWSLGLWRAAISCVAVAILLGTLSLVMPGPADNNKDLTQDFENTLLASVDQTDTSVMP